MTADRHKATGYDKYIDWKVFIFPVLILVIMLVMPPLKGIEDVGTEYAVGEKVAIEHLAQHVLVFVYWMSRGFAGLPAF